MCPQSITETKSPKSHGTKRGRPKTETLPEKIREGEEINSEYQCSVCRRIFPRRKSLIAHERTHTDERPYSCDYPGCIRAFRQSGQLKTHQRRHTGEKPFACPFPACQERYIHSNRRCREHPQQNLVRDGNEEICREIETLSYEEVEWLERYKSEKENPVKRRRIDSDSSDDFDPELLMRIKTESDRFLEDDELITVYVLMTMRKCN